MRALSRRPSASNCAARNFCERSSALVSARDNSSAVLRASDSPRGELAEQRRGLLGHESFTFYGQPVGLRGEPSQLVFDLLDARPLDLGSLIGGALLAIEVFPALLPAG